MLFGNRYNKKGFTLAEVLITLGIIGVVAAMTMPTLINNYQRKVIVEQLKKSYSTISQALVTSQSENGEFADWGIGSEESDWGQYKNKLSGIIKQNIIPYLKVVQDCEFNKCKSAADVTFRDGHISNWHSDNTHYLIYLADGTRIMFYINNSNDADGVNRWHDLAMFIDINGDTKPNVLGKDVFQIYFKESTQKVVFHGVGMSRTDLLRECKSKGYTCGGLIQLDGWQMAKDYPW